MNRIRLVAIASSAITMLSVGSMLMPSTTYAQTNQINIQSSAPSKGFSSLFINNMSNDGTSANLNAPANSTVQINSASISGGFISISGSVLNGTSSIPFNLSGTLYRTQVTGLLSAAATDSLGNVNVIRMELSQTPSDDEFINHSLSGPALALYLQVPGTRNFALSEIPLTQVFSSSQVSSIFQNDGSLQLDNSYTPEVWISKMFKPQVVITKGTPTIATSTTVNPSNAVTSATTGTAVPNPAVLYTWEDSYADVYNTNGTLGTITDNITLQFEANEPTTWGQGNSNAYTMRIASASSTESGHPGDVFPSSWQVGVNGPVTIALGVGAPSYIQGGDLNGSAITGGSRQFSFSFSPTWYGFGPSFGWNPGGPTQIGTFVPTNVNNTHQMELQLENNEYMEGAGQYITAEFTGENAQQGTSSTSTIDFAYNLYNNIGNDNLYNLSDSQSWTVN